MDRSDRSKNLNQLGISEKHFVYLASCANGTLYTGYTTRVERRLAVHNAGRGGHYTRSNRPLSLIAAWPFNSRSEALQAEHALKQLPAEQKLRMAEAFLSLGGMDK
jgi:putative endonuclease